MVEIIKNNQCLKIRVAYDQDGGCIDFQDFFDESGLERLSDRAYAYFPNAPRWTEEELRSMHEDERQEWQDTFDWDWSRYTLADVSWEDWYEVAQEEDVLPYRYTATGHSQGDWAYLYLLGMEEAEAEAIVRDFELYAYDTPYYYSIGLIDCATGETIDMDSCGGIYDADINLEYLKDEIRGSLRLMKDLHPDLLTDALGAVNELEYSDVESN